MAGRDIQTLFSLIALALFSVACPEAGEDGGGGDVRDVGDRDSEIYSEPADERCSPSDFPELDVESLVEEHEFADPVHVTQSPGDAETFYIVQRQGRIVVVQDGEVLDEPFLDLRERVITEFPNRGLLGLAFHPQYEENGRFFIAYTSTDGPRNVVAEYQRSEEDPLKGDPEEVRRLVEPVSPKKQHNGGTVVFGPEGYLYATLGNGGKNQWKKDGVGRAQLLDDVFGTVMRLDVDNEEGEFAAPDNPFVDREGADPRIWVYGLRNPWRVTIDAKTGNAFIGDPGSFKREEIDFVPADSGGGQNFGWPAWEGVGDGNVPDLQSDIENHVEPVFDYAYGESDNIFSGGRVTVGGHVYRGESIPELKGYFVHGDLASEELVAMLYCDEDDDENREIIHHELLPGLEVPSSLRAVVPDNDGELLLVGKTTIERLVPSDN